MTGKIFYKKTLRPEYEGLAVWTKRWVSIRETECIHFCVTERAYSFCKDYDTAKALGVTMKRIFKKGSRFAFDTEDAAMRHLVMLKRKQIQHMTREIEFLKAAVSFFETGDDLEIQHQDMEIIPNTKDLVGGFLMFDY